MVELAGVLGELLTVNETAGWLKVSKQHVRNLIKTGKLAAARVRVGATKEMYRIRLADLEQFMMEAR